MSTGGAVGNRAHLGVGALDPCVYPPRELALAQELGAGAPLLRRLDVRLQAAAVVVLHGGLCGPWGLGECGDEELGNILFARGCYV